MSLVDRILEQPELKAEPPVLVDIGAAQGLHPKWRQIARYSICIAFEADERELGSVTSEAAEFRRLTTYNAIAAERPADSAPFHLTASPFCSSRLQPKTEILGRYAFAPLFEVERTVELRVLDVPGALAELGLERIDWFKADSQGTDLRLFRSLGPLAETVLVTEFEPGIIDAYEGEDKLVDVLGDLEGRGFWMSDLQVRGSTRIDSDLAMRLLGERARAYLDVCHRQAPGWAEVEYFSDFEDESRFGMRELLLGCAFALARGQHAFAVELAERGRTRFGGPFEEIQRSALRRLKADFARFPLAAVEALARRLLKR
jgi:hypothetical protein